MCGLRHDPAHDCDDAGHRSSRRARRCLGRRAGGDDHPHARDGRGAGRELGPPGHADGAGAGGVHAVAAASCASTRTTRSGRTATASCSRSATRRCCCTRCCTWRGVKAVNPAYERARRAVGAARGHQALPPARLAAARGTRSTAGRRASRRPRARSGRASRRRSAWRSRRSGWPRTSTARASSSSTTTSTRSCGDGDLMEGISAEAASLAGHLKLANLCWIYDNNRITIEGDTSLAFTEDVATRFIGYGWNVTRVGDANDREMLARAFETFKRRDDRPDADHRRQPHRLRRAEQAGHGRRARRAARRGGDPAHQARLRLARGRDSSSCPTACASTSPQGIGARGARAARGLDGALRGLPRRAPRARRRSCCGCSSASCPTAGTRTSRSSRPTRRGWPAATRRARCSTRSPSTVPWLLGGSADLAPSTKTRLTFEGAGDFERDRPRAGATCTSACASTRWARSSTASSLSKLRAFGSGFLIFSDYGRAPIRLGALMEIPAIHVFTHDSIGVGEDGPTHQPIEQLASLRAIPGLITLRPGDANEVAEAWRRDHGAPARPGGARAHAPGDADARPHEVRARRRACARGAYVLADAPDGDPRCS